MRKAFAQEITELAKHDDRIMLLVGDIGYHLFDEYRNLFPDRFINCGIAEQNMVSMAAGLASCGSLPVCYTIAPFLTAKCFEQIRLDVCYHNQPVTIVGVGAGLGYANLGPTHHALEDIALMRTLPNMRIAAPCDPNETRACLRTTLAQPAPTYLRLGKEGEPNLTEPAPFEFGKWRTIQKGRGACVLTYGPLVRGVLEQCRDAEIVNCASLKPLDVSKLSDVLDRWSFVEVVEEHSRVGGLRSALYENVGAFGRIRSMAMPDAFVHTPTTQGLALEPLRMALESSIVAL